MPRAQVHQVEQSRDGGNLYKEVIRCRLEMSLRCVCRPRIMTGEATLSDIPQPEPHEAPPTPPMKVPEAKD